MNYLANKTFLLPALSDQKQAIISERGHSRQLSKTTVDVNSIGKASEKGYSSILHKTSPNTLLHMKLQPRLHVTG
jgi:hypothetical protein